MFNPNLSNNDEDIFDDSKTLEDIESPVSKTNSSEINSSKINKKAFNAAMESVLDALNRLIKNDETSIQEAKQIVQHLAKEHKMELENFLTQFRVRLAATILDGAGSWIKEYQEFDIPRSVMYALDSVTENKFSILNRFFNIELEIAKRVVITRFLTDTFLSHDSNKEDVLKQLFDDGMDDRYLMSYYGALRDINTFTIYQSCGVYKALSEELDIPYNQDLLDMKEIRLDSLSPKEYSEKKFSNLMNDALKERIGVSVADFTKRYFDDRAEKNK